VSRFIIRSDFPMSDYFERIAAGSSSFLIQASASKGLSLCGMGGQIGRKGYA